jgi:HK97 family phage major capsid protein
MSTNELREHRAKLVADMRVICDKADSEKRSLTGEENQEWDRMHTETETLRSQIEKREKLDKLDAEMSEVRETRIGREDRKVSGSAMTSEQRSREVWKNYIVRGESGMSSNEVAELRALSVGTAGSGGYSAPAYAATSFVDKLRDFSGILQAPVYSFKTSGGNDLPFPVTDDTGSAGAETAEGTALAENVDVTFTQIVMKGYNFDSNIVVVSKQFLQDTIIPADEFLNNKLAERIATKANLRYTTGNGTTTCQGITVGAGNSSVALPTTTLGADAAAIYNNLVAIQHSVPAIYRNRPTAGWMFADSTLLLLKQMKDSQNRPLWVAGLTAGTPDLLLGKPFYVNSDMPAVATGNKSVIFGDFSQFYVRNVLDVEVVRLDERYAEKRQVGFLGHFRTDSKVMNSTAIKYAAHA